MRTAFAHPWLLVTLIPLLGLIVLAVRAHWLRCRALNALGPGLARSVQPERLGDSLRNACLLAGLFLLAVGIAGPQWGWDWEQAAAPGRDVVVVLDRSRSMLAEKPNRLQRGRTALLDLVDELKKRGVGQRLALVVFAAEAKLVCPLTRDYDHFREAVAAIDPDITDPELDAESGAISGTRIGRALHLALEARGASTGCDILLLSDGDDPARDGEWRDGAEAARQAGVPVLAIGLGDPDRATIVPAPSSADGRTFLQHNGKPVESRLEEGPLREIANITAGAYEPARTQTAPLGAIYLKWIASRPVREENEEALPVHRQRHMWFLTPAILLLAAATLLGMRMRDLNPSRSDV